LWPALRFARSWHVLPAAGRWVCYALTFRLCRSSSIALWLGFGLPLFLLKFANLSFRLAISFRCLT
jgi:hypothetical protein